MAKYRLHFGQFFTLDPIGRDSVGHFSKGRFRSAIHGKMTSLNYSLPTPIWQQQHPAEHCPSINNSRTEQPPATRTDAKKNFTCSHVYCVVLHSSCNVQDKIDQPQSQWSFLLLHCQLVQSWSTSTRKALQDERYSVILGISMLIDFPLRLNSRGNISYQ